MLHKTYVFRIEKLRCLFCFYFKKINFLSKNKKTKKVIQAASTWKKVYPGLARLTKWQAQAWHFSEGPSFGWTLTARVGLGPNMGLCIWSQAGPEYASARSEPAHDHLYSLCFVRYPWWATFQLSQYWFAGPYATCTINKAPERFWNNFELVAFMGCNGLSLSLKIEPV